MLLLASFIPCLLQVRMLWVWLSWMNTDGGQRSHVKRSAGLVHPEGVQRVSKVLFIFILFCLSSPPPSCSRDKVAWAGLELRICLLRLLNAGMPGVGHHTQLKYLFAWTKWTLICFFWIALQIMNGMERITECEQTLEKPEKLLGAGRHSHRAVLTPALHYFSRLRFPPWTMWFPVTTRHSCRGMLTDKK